MPILWHIMKTYSYYGVKDFILALGYKGEMIKEYFLNFEELSNNFTLNLRSRQDRVVHENGASLEDWKITFVDTGLETQTGGRIARIREYVGDDKEFLLTYGDAVADVNVGKLKQFHKAQGTVLTVTGINQTSPFGVIEVKHGRATGFKEKPKLDGLVSGGFFVCSHLLFDYLSADEGCVFEEEPMRRICEESQLAVYSHEGYWQCMDTYKQMLELNRAWAEGQAPWKIWE